MTRDGFNLLATVAAAARARRWAEVRTALQDLARLVSPPGR